MHFSSTPRSPAVKPPVAGACLDTSEARQALEDGAFADAVANDLNDAKLLGVTGVPFFVVDGRYALSGAQPSESFSQLLARAWEERDA